MDALSSMIRMRLLPTGPVLDMAGLRPGKGKFENEHGTAAGPAARHAHRAAELLRGESPAVQAEAVSVHAGREAVREQAGHVFRRYADAVVDDAYAYAGRRRFDAQRDELVGSAGFVARVLGVAHEIDQNLQNLVFVDGDRWHFAEFTAQ